MYRLYDKKNPTIFNSLQKVSDLKPDPETIRLSNIFLFIQNFMAFVWLLTLGITRKKPFLEPFEVAAIVWYFDTLMILH